MNKLKFKILMFIPVLGLLLAGCDQEPIFTEMSTNRLKIVLKGTLESETPPAFSLSVAADDSVNDLAAQPQDVVPATFMLDIAEIRLNGKKIGNYRQVFSIPLSDSQPFFNGQGVVLKNDDPGEGGYNTVQLFIRKMIFDNAMVYSQQGTWSTGTLAEVIFHEKTVNGFNFNLLQVNSYWDSLRTNASDIIRIFPLEIPITGGLDYDRHNDQTVLEIRIVVKNFIKMYEYDYYEDGIYKVCHYWALSDWLRDVRKNESYIGRNIHAVARAYVPGKTGTITNSTPTSGYVIAIPDGEQIADYSRTGSGAALRNATAVSNCDFPVAPVYSGTHMESVLDYYCNLEAYKVEWNAKLSTCPDFVAYSAAWEGYEASVEEFKIAPYVTIATGSGYTFNNVKPGIYHIYTHAVPSANSLFEGAWTSAGTVTVPYP